MRIAWVGPTPSETLGVPFLAVQLLDGLTTAGAEVDCYLPVGGDAVPESVRGLNGLRVIERPSSWRYDRWYSRTDLTKMVTGLGSALGHQFALSRMVADRHAHNPYDVLYQFSMPELVTRRPFRSRLPPIVVHPEVHAAGELRWHRRELALSRRSEPARNRAVATAVLAARSALQRWDLPLADGIIAPSARMGELLCQDCGVSPDRVRVVPNAVDLGRFAPPVDRPARRGPVRIVFVGRIAVRKGVELLVGLSHRLADLEGQVELDVYGNVSLWSDYRALLTDLYPGIGIYRGEMAPHDIVEVFEQADVAVQPSHYEPFALTVAEALACGVPVVTSDEVGASEEVSADVCGRFGAGDLDAFESAVRAMVDRVRSGDREQIAATARAEATRLFDPTVVGGRVLAALEALVGPR